MKGGPVVAHEEDGVVLLWQELLDELLDVQVVPRGRLPVREPARAQVLEQDGRGGGDELEEVLPVRAAQRRVREAGEVAGAAVEEAPVAAALPVAVVGGVGAEDEEQAEHAAQHEVRARRGDHAAEERPHGLGVQGIDDVDEGGEDGVGDEVGADAPERERARQTEQGL